MARPESREYQLRPLLDTRARIQRLNLALLKAIQHGSNQAFLGKYRDADTFFFATLEDLISSNFSLWRAAFLIYLSNSREARAEAMRRMLHGLLEDNSFLFPHEVASQSWLGPYYIEHSRSRLSNRVHEIASWSRSAEMPGLENIWRDRTPDKKIHLDLIVTLAETKKADYVDPIHFQFLFNGIARQFNLQLKIMDFVKWYAENRTNGEFGWPLIDAIEGQELLEVATELVR